MAYKYSKINTQGKTAPPGYHYMPDGTLMSDAEHKEIYGEDVEFTKVIRAVSINKSDIRAVGETRNINIIGDEGAKFVLKITQGANTYDFSTRSFTSSSTTSGEKTIDESGLINYPIIFSTATRKAQYDILISPSAGTILSNDISKANPTISIYQYDPIVITWDTIHTTAGYTIAAALDTTYATKANVDLSESQNSQKISLTGAITKSSALLYTTRQPTWTQEAGGDFTNTNYIDYKILSINSSEAIIKLDDDTDLIDGMTVTGRNITEDITISKDGGNIITLIGHSYWPKFKYDQKLYFSMGGHKARLETYTIAGTGTVSLTGTIAGYIDKTGFADQTIQWQLVNNVTTVPNAYDMAVNCSITDVTTSFSVQDGDSTPQGADAGTCSRSSANNWTCTVQEDVDANKDTKTYALVSKSGMTVDGELKGVIGNNSAAFNNDTFYTGSTLKDKITFKYAAGSAGDTCSFTYKANDGTTDSATKTVTITLTA